MKFLTSLALVASTLLFCACPARPPNLSVAARHAFTNTQVVKVLDLVRDSAVSANAMTPPLVSTETTRKIVQFHASTLKVIDATTTGWQKTVQQSLQAIYDNLPPAERTLLAPYINLGLDTLKGLQ